MATAHCDKLNDKETKGAGGSRARAGEGGREGGREGERFIKTLIISSADALIE